MNDIVLNNKKYGLSYLRTFSCMLVVLLHTAYSAVLLFEDGESVFNINFSYSIVYCCMAAVPCFVMITGALLLPKEKEIGYKKLFGKYILRVFFALLLFSVIFRVFDIIMDEESFSFSAFMYGFKEFYTADGWSHLWYLYLIIGLYLLLPFYKMITEKAKPCDLKYLLAVYFIFLSLLPILDAFTVKSGFYIHTSTIYPFYLFLGYYLCYGNTSRIKPIHGALMLAVSLIVTVGITLVYRKTGEDCFGAFFKYSSPAVALGAVGLFILFKDLKQVNGVIDKILNEFDRCSFGIYIVHMLYVRLFLRYMNINPFDFGGVFGLLLLSLFFLLISYITVRLLKLIPFLKKLV